MMDVGFIAGTYRVIKLIGAGAEGEAYQVEDQDGKDWVLKLIKLPLPRRALDSIIREIQLQSDLGDDIFWLAINQCFCFVLRK
jgi:serine/threonine protein kinase